MSRAGFSEALNPARTGSTLVVNENASAAVVREFGNEGNLARVFEVSKREDGWWPDRFKECAG